MCRTLEIWFYSGYVVTTPEETSDVGIIPPQCLRHVLSTIP